MKKSKLNPEVRRERIAGYLFMLPNLIGFTVFVAYPVLYGLVLSFMKNTTLSKFSFVGLENFIEMFTDPRVINSLKNNVIYSFITVPLTVILALFVAVLVFNLPRFNNAFKNVLFLPYITSSIAVATVWKVLYLPSKGAINSILMYIGIAEPPRWLVSQTWALPAIMIVAIWQAFGYTMLFLLAGLQGIPKDLYEAGEMDGAVGFKSFCYITFPMLSPTLFFVLIINMINSFKVFDLILQMTEGGPAGATNVLVFRIYQEGIANLNMGYASAIAMLLFVIVLSITIIQFVLQKRWVFYAED